MHLQVLYNFTHESSQVKDVTRKTHGMQMLGDIHWKVEGGLDFASTALQIHVYSLYFFIYLLN